MPEASQSDIRHTDKPFIDQLLERSGSCRREIKLTIWQRIARIFARKHPSVMPPPRRGYRWETDHEVCSRTKLLTLNFEQNDNYGMLGNATKAARYPSTTEDDGNEP